MMVKIKFSKRFKKQFAKLPTKVKATFKLRLELFIDDPNSKLLRVHKLSGRLNAYSSFSVTGDYGVIYRIEGDMVYIFEMIGTHAQLYK
jgi:addiction module RelE/StbE family toxin